MADSGKLACESVLQKIDQVLSSLSGLEEVVRNGKSEQKAVLEEAIRHVLSFMKDLDASAASLADQEVPAKLLQWLDEGKDPDAFYQMLFNETIWGSQVCTFNLREVIVNFKAFSIHNGAVLPGYEGKLNALASGRQSVEAELQGQTVAGEAGDKA